MRFEHRPLRSEPVKLPVSAGPPSGGQAASLTPLSPLSSLSYDQEYVPGPRLGSMTN